MVNANVRMKTLNSLKVPVMNSVLNLFLLVIHVNQKVITFTMSAIHV